MNGLGRNNDNKTKKQSVLTSETLGVVLILFATLCMVCLITRDAVFSEPGRYVNAFLHGCFGVFAYAVVIWLIILGVLLVSGKKTGLSLRKKALLTCTFVLTAILTHIISMSGFEGSYGEYLAKSYAMADGGVTTASAGGFVIGLVAYVFPVLLSNVGSYIVLGAGIILSLYFLVREFVLGYSAPEKSKKKFRSSFVKKEEKPVEPTVKIEGIKEYPVENVVPVAVQPESKGKQRLFVNNPDDFALRSKREVAKNKDASAIKLGFSEHGLGVVTGTKEPALNPNDYKSKLDYIKTPPTIDVNKMTPPTYTPPKSVSYAQPYNPENRTTVSDYIQRSNAEPKTLDEIPHLEHDGGKIETDDAKHRAETFGSRYADMSGFATEKAEDVKNNEQNIGKAESIETKIDEVPFIEERGDIREQIVEAEMASEKNEQPLATDEPPVSEILSSDRVRSILFGEDESKEEIAEAKTMPETPATDNAFTSRVEADNNIGSRRRIFENSAENKDENKPEEKPALKQDKPKAPINRKYHRPPFDLLETHRPPVDAPKEDHEGRMDIIQKTLAEVRIEVNPQNYIQGPSVTRYELFLPDAANLSKIPGYADSLKMRLRVEDNIRIEAPIPGKDLIGVEVANRVRIPVGLKEVMEGLAKNNKGGSLVFALGKDVVGNAIGDDLAKGPHYLIAGATGSGKSVCLHVMICSLLIRYSPEELKLVLVDPKLNEFNKYEHIPHLLVDEIVTDTKRAVALLHWAYEETTRRNEIFAATGGMVSNIDEYNANIANETTPKMPRIVFFIDELADLMESHKKELEEKIRRVAAKSRSAGIHLVLATQRPSVDVVTGTIKTNLPSRIALKLMNFADSQTILSKGGAEKLLGNGDMLYQNSKMSDAVRYQGAFLTNREIMNIVNYIKEKNTSYFDDEVMEYLDQATKEEPEEVATVSAEGGGRDDEFSELFLQALWLAVSTKTISISQLQRRFQIGYAKAGGLVDKMERLGFVSANEGSKARRVLLSREDYENRFGPAQD